MYISNNIDFRIIPSSSKLPSKLEVVDGENIILLNDVSTRASDALLFDIHRLMAHIFIPAGRVSDTVKRAEKYLADEDIDVPDRRHLTLEMACDQYAIEAINYSATGMALIKPLSLDIVKMMYPDFVLAFLGQMTRSMNESIEIRIKYINYLFNLHKNRKEEDNARISIKRANELKSSLNAIADEYGFGKVTEKHVDIPVIYSVCKKLKLNQNVMDSFDKSLKRIFNCDWSKIKYSNELVEFVNTWVKSEYKKYQQMISEKDRTPQRAFISNVLYKVICEDQDPTDYLIDKTKIEMNQHHNDRKNLSGLMSYNERKGIV